MPKTIQWLVVFGIVLLTALPLRICAQPASEPDSETPEKPTTAPPSPSGWSEVKPDTYYVLNEDGELVAVPGITYEDLMRLYKLDLQVTNSGPPLPAYSLQELALKGTANKQRAKLEVNMTIRQQRDGWVAVPLRMSSMVFNDLPQYQGEGDLFLDLGDDDGGYVCWLRGKRDQSHQLRLQAVVAVRNVGSEMRLPLSLPRATSSELELKVDLPRAAATTTSGLLVTKANGNSTTFNVAGLAGDFQIDWRQRGNAVSRTRPLFDVRSQITVQVEGERLISNDINLSVRSLSGDFDTFFVRLPKSSQLAAVNPPDLQAVLVNEKGEPATDGELVQIKVGRATTGPVNVRLSTYMNVPDGAGDAEYDFGDLQVREATRHSGTIDFAIKDNWAVNWTEGTGVRRVAEIPEALRDKISARFEFVQQPLALAFDVARKVTRVTVRPSYKLFVEANRARLEATLQYRVSGTAVYAVKVNMPGWQIDGVTPENLVAVDKFSAAENTALTIPLTQLIPAEDGTFDLNVSASREIANPDDLLKLELPRPVADTVSPAEIIVLPADNVELSLDDEASLGLERETSPRTTETPIRQQPAIFLRERGDASKVLFAAQLKVRERSVSIAMTGTAQFNSRTAHVEQVLAYQISYVPMRRIALDVPKDIFESTGVKVLLEGQALPLTEMVIENAEEIEVPGDGLSENDGPGSTATVPNVDSPASTHVRIQADLTSEHIGKCEISVQFDAPLPNLPPGEPASFELPLAVPVLAADTTFASSEIAIIGNEHLQVNGGGGAWNVGDSADDASVGLILKSDQATSTAPVRLLELIQRRFDSLAVPQQWVQTILTSSDRRDRVVFRVLTDQTEIIVAVPREMVVEDLAVDGRRIEPTYNDDAELVVELSAEPSSQRHFVVELWCRSNGLKTSESINGQIELACANVLGAEWTKRFYWQVVTPGNTHLVRSPPTMTSEWTWHLAKNLWSRQPTMEQAELERWIGATRQQALPPSVNQYLFSSFGSTWRLHIHTANRQSILLTASGATLAIGLLLIYVHWLRHPASLFLLGMTLLAIAAIYPDVAILTAQASGLGLGMVGMAVGLKWFTDYRLARQAVVRGRSIASPDSQTVKAPSEPSSGTSYPTTASLPIALQLPSAEPKSS